METNWQDSIYRQREELARMLREPIECCARAVTPVWHDRQQIEETLLKNFSSIPYCNNLYALDYNGVQICDNIGAKGILKGHMGRDRSQRPYMKEAVPSWGFLLSDAYISLYKHRPSLTALQVIRDNEQVQGYLGVDFDLRDLPVTTELYREPENWRQIKGDPAIRKLVFQQTRVESLMDQHREQAFAILEEMLTRRGVFQMQIHFSSSQATIWMMDDPFRYRILDMDALIDPDICMLYPRQEYPANALIPADTIEAILENLQMLRTADENIYLRLASINLFNGMISLTFSCDGSHYMPYGEFLQKNADFWFGNAA
ncbi:MAG: PDC sensor domain-containing protein [Gammaproteobacteria bacterium]|nr:PDC sensor domain-containing protein [Gammaproteobacteria bacterium]